MVRVLLRLHGLKLEHMPGQKEEAGEFYPVDVAATVDLLIVLLVGLLRQKGLNLIKIKGIKETAVDFCRRSLVNTEFEHG